MATIPDDLAGNVHPVERKLLDGRPRFRFSPTALLVTVALNGSVAAFLLQSTVGMSPPPKRRSIRLLFLAAPPPPPPPKGEQSQSRPRLVHRTIVAGEPEERPTEKPAGKPEGHPEGVEAGVQGGVPGGVPGGVLGGTGEPPIISSTNPVLLDRVDPDYPAEAREQGISGSVLVEALVGITGAVESVNVIQSIPQLDAAAIDAVRRWRFEPATRNGRPIPATIRVRLRFGLAAA